MMLKPSLLLQFRSLLLSTSELCFQCQKHALRTPTRPFSSALILRASSTSPDPPTSESSQKDEEFIPKSLGRPIGFPTPPQGGDNTGVDSRTLRQRRKDLTNWDKHLERRNALAKKMSKSYFRDFTNMKYHKGKTFFANPKIFKSEAALYFPNLRGTTLEAEKEKDTTEVMRGKISVVSIFSSAWGEAQVNTFTGKKQNTELHSVLADNKDVVQRVDVNIEENTVKAWILRLFHYRLRAQRDKEEWGKYFIVRKGVSDLIRETIGLMNGRVGYIYLLDRDCKIRWAASGNAEGEEKENMIKGLRRLIEDARKPKDETRKVAAEKSVEKGNVDEELEAQATNAGAS